jgi:hypothetical protein
MYVLRKDSFIGCLCFGAREKQIDSMQARKMGVKSTQNQIIRKNCFKMNIKQKKYVKGELTSV